MRKSVNKTGQSEIRKSVNRISLFTHLRISPFGLRIYRFTHLRISPRRGFSLIELILYVALFSVILIAISGFALEFITAKGRAAALEETLRTARYALARISQETREAGDLIGSATSTFVALPCDPSNPSTTSKLALGPSQTSGSLTIFCVVDGALRLSTGDTTCNASDPALTATSTNVTDFRVQNLSLSAGLVDAIAACLTVEYKNPGGQTTFNASTTLQTTAILHKGEGVTP